MDFDLEEKNWKKEKKKYTIIAYTILGILLLIPVSIYFLGRHLFSKTYYTLNLNETNKKEILNILEKEKENIFGIEEVCPSMYKIEYTDSIPDGTRYTIYCKDGKRMDFGIDKVEEDTLHHYLFIHGKKNRR